MHPFATNWLRAAVSLSLLILGWLLSPLTNAGEITLKSGQKLSPGSVSQLATISLSVIGGNGGNALPFYMLDDGMRRYFVGTRQILQPVSFDRELAQFEKFDIKQRKQGAGFTVESIGPYLSLSPFSEHGHREAVVIGPGKKPVTLFQGITQLRPHSCTVTGLNHNWEFSVATTSLRKEELQPLLRLAIDLENPNDRFGVVSFYQQAGKYELALEELETIAKELPDQRVRCDEAALQARQLLARRMLLELKHRREAGQHRLAAEALAAFPTEHLGADILRDLRQFQTEFSESRDKMDRVKHLLGDLQSGLSDEQRKLVAPLRDEINEQLDLETLPRLVPFLRLEKDDKLTPDQKLALAYSGWVVGDANATTELGNAIRWWQARFHVMQYLRANHPTLRQQALADLKATEGIGPATIEQIIPLLPPVIDTLGLESSKVHSLQVLDPTRSRGDEDDSEAFRYSVLVPQEFNPHHKYPLIVAMHEGGSSPERVLKWWGGDEASPLQSQRHGYIVIAPEYLPPKPGDPLPAPTEAIVRECLRDVRRRFVIDSDRIFLTGHGRGAEGAFDAALAQPDLFAGVIPISGGLLPPKGSSSRDTVKLRENVRSLAWYPVMGEFDFGLYDRHTDLFESLLLNGVDVLVCQYKARGHETFYSEIHRLFEWMDLHRRSPEPTEVDFHSLRTTDVRFHWARWSDASPNPPRPTKSNPTPKSVSAINLKARILPGETETRKITVNGKGSVTLWLNASLVDFNKRLVVEVDGKRRPSEFLQPEIEAVLEDFRQRCDRQRLHSVRLFID